MQTDRPDPIWKKCLDCLERVKLIVAEYHKYRQKIKGEMYDLAGHYRLLAKEHPQWLYQMSKPDGGLDPMLYRWFQPLRMIGEDHEKLFLDIDKKALTRDQYLRTTAGTPTRAARVKELTEKPEPPPITEAERRSDMSVEAYLELVCDERRELRAQNAEIRKDNRTLRRDAADQEKRIRDLEQRLYKIDRALGHEDHRRPNPAGRRGGAQQRGRIRASESVGAHG